MTNEYWSELYEAAQDLQNETTGTICRAVFDSGYWVYASGISGSERGKCFFPYGKDREAAKKAAQQFAKSYGGRVDNVIAIHAFAEGATYISGAPASWNSDQWWLVSAANWVLRSEAPSAVKALLANMEKLGIKRGAEGWFQFVRENDPYKVSINQMDDTDQEGNPRYKTFHNVVRAFANKEEAMAVVGTEETESETIPFDQPSFAIPMPDGWDAETWGDVVEDLKAQTGAPKEVVDYAAATYGVTITLGDVVKLRR